MIVIQATETSNHRIVPPPPPSFPSSKAHDHRSKDEAFGSSLSPMNCTLIPPPPRPIDALQLKKNDVPNDRSIDATTVAISHPPPVRIEKGRLERSFQPTQATPSTMRHTTTRSGSSHRATLSGSSRRHDRRPPNLRFDAPPRDATPWPRTAGGVFRSLWRKVEGGLDQLVHFEEAVADRAQQLYARSGSRFFPRALHPPEAVEPLDWSRFRKTIPVAVEDHAAGPTFIAVANGGAAAQVSESTAVVPPPPPPPPPESAARPDPGSTREGMPSSRYGSSIQVTRPTSERLLPTATTRMARWPSTRREAMPYFPVDNPTIVEHDMKPKSLSFDEEENTVLDMIKKLVPPLPNLRNFWRNRKTSLGDLATLDAWNSVEMSSLSIENRRGIWRWLRSTKSNDVKKSPMENESTELLHTEPMEDLTSRFRNGKMSSLLNVHEEELCQVIGRGKALWDLVALMFVVAGVRELASLTANFRLPNSLVEALTTTISDLIFILAASTETWIPIVWFGAFLACRTKYLLCDRKEMALIESVKSSIREESQYGSLFLRLVSSIPVERSLPDKMTWATISQIATKIGGTHLRILVMGIMTAFFVILISPLRLLFFDVFGVFLYILPEVNRHSVVSWSEMRQALRPICSRFSKLIRGTVQGVMHNPILFLYMASLLVSFVSVTLLPSVVERNRWGNSEEDDGEGSHDEAEKELQIRFTEQLSHLGASSASRLDLCSVDGRIDYFLQRWRMMTQPSSFSDVRGFRNDIVSSWMTTARVVGYCALSSMILLVPLLILLRNSLSFSVIGDSWLPLRMDSWFDCAAALFLTQCIVWRTLQNTIAASEWKERVSGFITQLNAAISERRTWLSSASSHSSIRSPHQPYITPTAGITVSDLWASHSSKRAWAVRGASFFCRNGEVVALLGDDGAGKTRLLTTVAEAIFSPPKSASTTQKVRGTITIGGLDITKWNDNRQLRKHVGIALSDVRFVSDTAQILSGLSLEEILDPCLWKSTVNPTKNSRLGKVAIMLASKITGIDAALLQRLPSKMSTIVTANEDELLHAASLLRPRFLHILSFAEWSKLLLTRTIAKAIYENDHRQSDPSIMSNSLVGSVLLLDDLTLHLSEVEEARLLTDLRLTGAATIFSSHRWVSGRLADHIIVMKDGAVVETGTHAELINRGPQYSLYAAKWYAITNS